jgi:hypothetical protein
MTSADGHESWQYVADDVDLWQAEALCLPLSMVQGKAVAWLNQLAHRLNDLNEATSHDDIVEAFTQVVIAAVASGIYTLGGSQRSPTGFRIHTCGASVN